MRDESVTEEAQLNRASIGRPLVVDKLTPALAAVAKTYLTFSSDAALRQWMAERGLGTGAENWG